MLVTHDGRMCILYRFHGWLILTRVIALFMFVWLNVRIDILCTQLDICLLSDFIHIWYLGWLSSDHGHIIPISWMVDFYESYIALFMFVWLNLHIDILCTQLVVCLLSNFIHIWYLVWLSSDHGHIMPISQMVDFNESIALFTVKGIT